MAVSEFLGNQKLLTEVFKFLLVGGINFLFTLALFYILVVLIGFNPIISVAMVSIAGIFLTYYLNSTWVFLPDQKIKFKRNLARYCIANGISIGMNMALLHLLLTTTQLSAFAAQFILIPLIVVFNFSTAKFWSLRR